MKEEMREFIKYAKIPMLWNKQGIRGKDVVIHSDDSTHNIILNIMPKYTFDRNIVRMNLDAI